MNVNPFRDRVDPFAIFQDADIADDDFNTQ
jgi:hypothetical protein